MIYNLPFYFGKDKVDSGSRVLMQAINELTGHNRQFFKAIYEKKKRQSKARFENFPSSHTQENIRHV